MCIALCASISEFYDMSIAAETLIEMVKTSRAPEELRPSILEWDALLKACAGVFATSTFPILAEKHMRLHPQHRFLGYEPLQGSKTRVRGCSSPESLAKALLAIAELTRGDIASFTVIGGADAGWLATFAEWLFELSVRMVLEATGEVLYSNIDDEQDAQMLIIYNSTDACQASHIMTTGKTYRLSDATLLIQRENVEKYTSACVTGRLEWNTLFESVFASDFKMLCPNPHALGGALGSLARIRKATATSEDKRIQQDFHSAYVYPNDASYGKGFIVHLVHQLPELAPFRDRMEEGVRQDLQNAFASYEAHIAALRLACNCLLCRGNQTVEERYCCVLILEVIVIMAQTLSIVTISIPVFPSRLGLEALYARQFLLREEIL